MSSEYADPAAPQSQIITTATRNDHARIGPYTDARLTVRNGYNATHPVPLPPRSGARTLGGITVYNQPTTKLRGPYAAHAAPPRSPGGWGIETVNGFPRSRDPYRVNGMTAQPFFRNFAG